MRYRIKTQEPVSPAVSASICRPVALCSPLGGNVLFNDALNTFYLRLYGVRHMVKDHSDSEKENPLPPHRLLLSINRRVLLYAPSHRQYNTYHGLCYTSRGAMAGTGKSSMGPPWRIDPTTHRTMSERSYHGATSRSMLPSESYAHVCRFEVTKPDFLETLHGDAAVSNLSSGAIFFL